MHTRLADYRSSDDLDRVIAMLDLYAQDPMGGAKALTDAVKEKLRVDLPSVPGAFSILAEDDAGAPLGVAICFMGYSTFGAKPLVN